MKNRLLAHWPDLGRERIMSDVEIEEQGKRIGQRKKDLVQIVICERCGKRPGVPTERYRVKCRRKIMRELERCGYLQKLGESHCGVRRTKEMKEDVFETKYGTDAGTGIYNALH